MSSGGRWLAVAGGDGRYPRREAASGAGGGAVMGGSAWAVCCRGGVSDMVGGGVREGRKNRTPYTRPAKHAPPIKAATDRQTRPARHAPPSRFFSALPNAVARRVRHPPSAARAQALPPITAPPPAPEAASRRG